MTRRQGRGLCPCWAGCRPSCPCSICPDLSGSWASELWEGGHLRTWHRSLGVARGRPSSRSPGLGSPHPAVPSQDAFRTPAARDPPRTPCHCLGVRPGWRDFLKHLRWAQMPPSPGLQSLASTRPPTPAEGTSPPHAHSPLLGPFSFLSPLLTDCPRVLPRKLLTQPGSVDAGVRGEDGGPTS